MLNPFYIYSLSYLIVLLIYELRWSQIYPNISIGLFIFITCTSVISFIIGLTIKSKNKVSLTYSKKILQIESVLFVGFLIDFVYSKQIPLFSSLGYNKFTGIKTVHSLLVTLNVFMGVYIFSVLNSTKNKKLIWIYLLNFVPSILLMSRGIPAMIVLPSILIYINNEIDIKNFLRSKKTLFMIISVLLFMYIFGLTGNIRHNKERSDPDLFNSKVIFQIGVPSDSFINGSVPNEFFWTYLYMSSPLANLQTTINANKSVDNIKAFFWGTIVPDLISKRVMGNDYIQSISSSPDRISQSLTVSTCYSSPYNTLGYFGMLYYYFYLIFICIVYSYLLKFCGQYYEAGMALLCTVIMLGCFNNIFAFSAFSFPLLWPLILTVINKVYPKVLGEK